MNTLKQMVSYIARQKGWLKANDIQLDDLILVKKSHEDHSKGWSNTWNNSMDYYVGKVFSFILYKRKDPAQGLMLKPQHLGDLRYKFFPYTVLQKIWVKPYGTPFERGDIVFHTNMCDLFMLTDAVWVRMTFSEVYVTLKRKEEECAYITSPIRNIRHATRDEIIQFYNHERY